MVNILFAEDFTHISGTNGGFYTSVGSFSTDYSNNRMWSYSGTASGAVYTLPSVPTVCSNALRLIFTQSGNSAEFYLNRNTWMNVMSVGNIYLQLNPMPYTVNCFDRIRAAVRTSSGIVELQAFTFPRKLAVERWYHFEMKVDRTNNTVVVQLNGVPLFTHNMSNADALSGTNSTVGIMQGWTTPFLAYAPQCLLRDWVAADELVGPAVISHYLPGSDTGTTQWIPNAGTVHYSRVNTATGVGDGDSSYVFAKTPDQTDLYNTTGTLATLIDPQPVGLVVNTVARRQINGTRTYTNAISSGGVVSAGAEHLPPDGTYARTQDPFSIDPHTGSAWASVTDISSSQIGIKLVS